MSDVIQLRTKTELRRFVRSLETMKPDMVHEQLRDKSTDLLCEMNGMASNYLKPLIQREIRNTDG